MYDEWIDHDPTNGGFALTVPAGRGEAKRGGGVAPRGCRSRRPRSGARRGRVARQRTGRAPDPTKPRSRTARRRWRRSIAPAEPGWWRANGSSATAGAMADEELLAILVGANGREEGRRPPRGVSTGTLGASLVLSREVFRTAATRRAAAIVPVHNHSYRVTPL